MLKRDKWIVSYKPENYKGGPEKGEYDVFFFLFAERNVFKLIFGKSIGRPFHHLGNSTSMRFCGYARIIIAWTYDDLNKIE